MKDIMDAWGTTILPSSSKKSGKKLDTGRSREALYSSIRIISLGYIFIVILLGYLFYSVHVGGK